MNKIVTTMRAVNFFWILLVSLTFSSCLVWHSTLFFVVVVVERDSRPDKFFPQNLWNFFNLRKPEMKKKYLSKSYLVEISRPLSSKKSMIIFLVLECGRILDLKKSLTSSFSESFSHIILFFKIFFNKYMMKLTESISLAL